MERGGAIHMDNAVKDHIIKELDRLPDRKVHSLLEYLNALMDEDEGNYPNARTRAAIEELDENHGSLPAYSSSDELFADMDIDV